MNRRNINITTSVIVAPISASSDRNCWSKPSLSIIHQVEPCPGVGTARNTNMMIAVPTSVRRESTSSTLTRRDIRNTMIAIDPRKMISWLYGISPSPMLRVNTTKTRLPPSIHQFGAGASACTLTMCQASVRPWPFCLSSLNWRHFR